MSLLTVLLYIVIASIVLGVIFIANSATFRLAYVTWNMPGPSLWKFIIVYARKLLSTEHMLLQVSELTEHYLFKPWGFWTMTGDYLIVVSDPQTVSAVFQNQHLSNKPQFLYSAMSDYLGTSSMVLNNTPWKIHRKLINSLFKKTVLDTNMVYVTNLAEKFMQSLQKKANGASFDIGPMIDHEIFKMTIAFLGSDTASLPDEFYEGIRIGAGLAQLKTLNPIYHWFLMTFSNDTRKTHRRIMEMTAIGKAEFKKEVERRKLVSEEYNDALSIFVKKDSEIEDDVYGEDEVMDEAITLVSVGSDTTATSTTTIIAILALYQDVQQRVLEELEGIFEDKDQRPTPKDLDRMEYLQMVIKETMRLFPAGPMLPRKADEDTTVNGTMIPKGSCVVINVLSLHRNPENFEDPLTFKPERFSADTETDHPNVFLPFSSGLRNCVGQAHAMIVMKIVLSTLLRNYQIRLGEGIRSMDDIKCKMCVTMNVSGVNVRLIRRYVS